MSLAADKDSAWVEIAEGLLSVVAELPARRQRLQAQAVVDEGKVRVLYPSRALDLDGAKKALEQELAGKGYTAPKAVGGGTALTGARASITLDLPQGCARIDVLAGKPLVDLSAELWDDRGALQAEARGGAFTPLFACGKGGPARVDIEALERKPRRRVACERARLARLGRGADRVRRRRGALARRSP